jgi:hypothetical protein
VTKAVALTSKQRLLGQLRGLLDVAGVHVSWKDLEHSLQRIPEYHLNALVYRIDRLAENSYEEGRLYERDSQ